jgi:hypothetical protein
MPSLPAQQKHHFLPQSSLDFTADQPENARRIANTAIW